MEKKQASTLPKTTEPSYTPRRRGDQKTPFVFPPSAALAAFLNKPSSLLCAAFLIEAAGLRRINNHSCTEYGRISRTTPIQFLRELEKRLRPKKTQANPRGLFDQLLCPTTGAATTFTNCIPTHPVYAHRSFQENMRAGGLCLCNLARNTLSSGEPAIAPGLGLPPSLEEPYEAEAPRGSALQREGRLASRALEMRPFGEAKCLEDGPDAAERRPRSGFPRAGGQETAISRHITTYRQHRRDPGR
nr:unnamed protein product [Digitaria exilis]CAB3502495.1 unnamed protein product [Digitaria exilis]CAB3503421.1 unnamed protein product [Digitaria exilis]CAB3505073.1 unnamed protein product [Digitaria exilis]